MEFKKLHYFLTTCACGSFSAAAKQLFTTRQAVSKAIRQLESELHVKLFVKHNNELRLTSDGEYLRASAETVFRELDDVYVRFLHSREMRSYLRVSMSLDAAALLPKLDFASIQEFGIILTEHSIRRCIDDLEKRAVDLCILSCMQKNFPPFFSRTICSDPLIFIVSSRVYKALGQNEKEMSISELSDYDILLLSDKEYVYADFLKKYRRLDLGDERLHTVSDQALMRRLVRSGTAVALAPSTYAPSLPDDLMGLRCSNRHLLWHVSAVYDKNTAHNLRVAEFVDYLCS